MKNKFALSILVFGSLSLSIASCDKDDDPANPVCRMNGMVVTPAGAPTSHVISYDEGKMVAITSKGSINDSRTFTYTKGGITVVAKDGTNKITGTDEVSLNASGKISSITHKDGGGTITGTKSYVYNSAGQMIMYISTPTNAAADTTTYVYNEGNVTLSTYKGANTLYTYYEDKIFADGDRIKTPQILSYGALAWENHNLLKSIISPAGIVTEYTYQYDVAGKIIGAQVSGGMENESLTYTYECP